MVWQIKAVDKERHSRKYKSGAFAGVRRAPRGRHVTMRNLTRAPAAKTSLVSVSLSPRTTKSIEPPILFVNCNVTSCIGRALAKSLRFDKSPSSLTSYTYQAGFSGLETARYSLEKSGEKASPFGHMNSAKWEGGRSGDVHFSLCVRAARSMAHSQP